MMHYLLYKILTLVKTFTLTASALLFLLSLSAIAMQPKLHWHRQSLGLSQEAPNYISSDGLVKVAFLDLDGTIRISGTDVEIISNTSQIRILPGVVEKLIELKNQGYFIAITSNHAWVPKTVPHDKASLLIYETILLLNQAGAIVHYYDYAGDNADALKPEPGMAKILDSKLKEIGLKIDYPHSFMIGDDGYGRNTSDSGFAKSLDIPYKDAQSFFGWKKGCKEALTGRY